MDNFEIKDDHKKRSLMSKLFLPAAVIGSIGFGVYTYQNAQNTEDLDFEPKVVAFADLNLNPENTEFDKLVRKDFSYSDDASSLFSEEQTSLYNSDNPMSSLQRFAVGQAGNPHRCMINHSQKDAKYWNNPKNSMNYAGWQHYYSFLAFSDQIPGSKRVAVGQAGDPHRAMLNHPSKDQDYWNQGHSMTFAGWSQYLEFWALDGPRPGAVRVAVGQAGDPHRAMLNHPDKDQDYWNQGHSMTFAGWQHYNEFWAYPDDLVIDRLDYELDKGQIVDQQPRAIFSQTLINRSSVAQTNTISFSYTKSESFSWSHSLEVGLTVTAGGKAGVPFVAEGKWEVSVSTKYNFQTTKSVETSETRQYSSPVNVGPHSQIEAKCTIQEAKMAVPYTIKFSSKYGEVAEGLKGMWNGVSVSHVQCDYIDKPLY